MTYKRFNPRGRPKKSPELREVEALARAAAPGAIRRLVHLIKADDGRVSIAACNAILDRGFGKPAQALEHKGTVTHDMANLSDSELAAIIGEANGGTGSDTEAEDTERLH